MNYVRNRSTTSLLIAILFCVCMYIVSICWSANECIHICALCTYTYVYLHIFTCWYTYTYLNTYTYTNRHIYSYSNTHINAIIIYTHAYSHTLPGNLDICSYTAYAHVQMTTCNCIYEHISRYVDIHQCVQSRYKEIQHAII